MYKTLELTLDTERTNNTKTNAQNFLVNTNDYESVKIIADIVQDKERVDLSDATVKLAIRKPDKTIVFQDGTVTAAIEGECEFVLETQSYILKGTHIAEVMIYFADGKIVVTRAFAYHVAEGILTDTAIESTSWYQDVNELQLAVQELQVEVDAFIDTAVAETRAEITEVDQRLTSQLAEKTQQIKKLEGLGITTFKAVAHQGYPDYAPENTMAAFTNAVALGAEILECDVQISSDGIPVIIHDSTVDRTTEGTGNVASMTFDQLRALDAGSFYSPYHAGTKIPSFEEFLKYSKGRCERIYPEIKGVRTIDDVQIIMDMIKAHDMEDMTTIQAFDLARLQKAREYSDKVQISLLVYDSALTQYQLDTLVNDGNAMVGYYYGYIINNPGIVKTLYDLGIDLFVWVSPSKYVTELMLRLGVSKIVIDNVTAGVER